MSEILLKIIIFQHGAYGSVRVKGCASSVRIKRVRVKSVRAQSRIIKIIARFARNQHEFERDVSYSRPLPHFLVIFRRYVSLDCVDARRAFVIHRIGTTTTET